MFEGSSGLSACHLPACNLRVPTRIRWPCTSFLSRRVEKHLHTSHYESTSKAPTKTPQKPSKASVLHPFSLFRKPPKTTRFLKPKTTRPRGRRSVDQRARMIFTTLTIRSTRIIRRRPNWTRPSKNMLT